MAEIVNLRRLRKRKQRGDEAKAAAENRVVHGQTAAEKARAALLQGLDAKRLDGHRRQDSDGDGER